MTDAYQRLLADFDDEVADLDAVVDSLSDRELGLATPAQGWTVVDQLSHLAGFDEAATLALVEPEAFTADLARRLAAGDDPIAGYTAQGRSMEPSAVRSWWHTARRDLAIAAAQADPRQRIPWYGPSMSAMSHVTARVMEAWAHGQDIRDTFSQPPSATHRLRHVAHIGIGARTFSYVINGLDAPGEQIDVVLSAPDGSEWTWGDGGAVNRVEGPALDFCLLVTQRRHRDDTALTVVGAEADRWMSIAQAFAGDPSSGRSPGQFA